MNVRDYLLMLVQSYNPNQYEKMMEERLGKLMAFLALTTLFGLILFAAVLLPAAYSYIGELPVTLDQVEEFRIDGTVSAQHPVTLLSSPSVILDVSGNTTDPADHELVFSAQGMHYPKYLFFGDDFLSWEDLRDLKNPTPTRDRVLTSLVLFILPSVLFWFLVYTLLKLALLFFGLLLLGYWVPRIFKSGIRFGEVVRVGILSLPSVLLIGIGLYPLAPGPLFWWGMLLTTIIFAVGIFCISERELEPRGHVFTKKR